MWPRTGGNHVNFALADLGDTILCIGGNQGNGRGGGVTIAKYPRTAQGRGAAEGRGDAGGRGASPSQADPARPKPPLEAPEPEKPKKTGVSEGATVGAGLGSPAFSRRSGRRSTQAPEHLLDVLVRAAQKPQFWLFVAVARHRALPSGGGAT